ncbi:hypothetical protein PR202_gb20584 [Eleusine coracana subsp. coracana]|uniref:SBP-type domain-containing protein n=1 Tax=Eleusine coracana subsp. coracana TaxID=191504 RepID=A0AAV5FCL6_ELECO|nr:hypothetical protein PR202_gb20584 [Eleusine coracana subsp. coracana]
MDAGFLWKENGHRTDVARMSGGDQNKSLEWNMNDWRWDTHMFLATPSSAAPLERGGRNHIRSQGEIDFGVVDTRRRVSPEDDSAECSNAAGTNGENCNVVVQQGGSSEENRPTKGASSSTPPSCQVDGCQADLSCAKDYHKRHKVCEAHTRSSVVHIKRVEHRFCQQCSRFHLLQEFDEGKKSCRSRLAQHNRRRRKVRPEAAVDGNSMIQNQSLSSVLFLLLKQLSGVESGSSSEGVNHPNHLVNLLKNLASIAGTQAYQDMLKNANSSNAGNYIANGFTVHGQTIQPIHVDTELSPEEPPAKRRVQDFDLNDAYIEDAECRTDKIVFKLFGKEPRDFPVNLRAQILNWLSHCPSEMESYIRPGCVILTVYLRLPNWMWDELDDDPAPWMEKLVNMSNDGFWRTGWVYARVQNWLTLSCNGSLVLASPWQPVIGDKRQRLCVTPIAVACSSTANFMVKGFNIVQPTTKCIEDYDQSSLSVPFVVTEEDVCSEIRMLEHELNLISVGETLEEIDHLMAGHDQALHFLQEIGWLLQRSHVQAMSDQAQSCRMGFSVGRFRWLLSFAVDHEWCAVVKKLLDIMFEGHIDLDVPSPVEFAQKLNLLFAAVNKRSKPLVECLLRYTTAPVDSRSTTPVQFLFTPEVTSSSSITPLHAAATISDAAGVLDALTDDPLQMGINVWKNARDATGFTPEDYARKRGFISYIQMVQEKIDQRIPKAHLSVAIAGGPCTTDIVGKHISRLNSTDKITFDVEKCSIKQPLSCNQCVQQLRYRPQTSRFLSNRPAVLSLVAIAAVCVCVGLLMKSPPYVGCMRPFLWEHIKWGPT